ncbi:COP1-interacting protein 7-like [Phragmites australis]|uniref:COP1-interacting protein 7-like n=1 Tax=Phragmites australis TaxID=29695 RepID=UPI002D76FF2A|nr:COP1-interacting protein 7-like [Phragmites australis]
MEADAPLDFALFQLSPRRQRCELVVSGNGRTEKIASGSVKPFVAHLRVAEEQAAAQPPPPAIRLQLERRAAWFSKGTLERFVRFVSTPEVLEIANNFDLEMSQLEGARKIYAQGGAGDATSGGAAENVSASAAAADITKKELLRAIDVRLSSLKQDLATACSRASSAGFNPSSVSELLLFANHFGANRLSEACTKFMSLCQRRPDISPQNAPPAVSSQWKGFDDGNVRGSSSSDMSIDEPQVDLGGSNDKSTIGGSDSQIHRLSNSQGLVHVASEPITEQKPKQTIQQAVDKQETETDASPAPAVGGGSRRLSVKDRINMFESQKKEQTPSSGNSNSAGTSKVVPGKGEHRRVPSGASMEKLVRRWSSVSDMSIDLSNNDSNSLNDKKENGTSVGTPTSTDLEGNSKLRADKDSSGLKDSVTSQSWPCQKDDISVESTTTNTRSPSTLNDTPASHKQTKSRAEDDMVINSSFESESSFGKEQGVIQGQCDTKMSDHAALNVSTRNRLKTSPKLADDTSLKDKDILKTSPSPEEHVCMIDKEITVVAHEVLVSSEQIGQNDTRGPRLRTKDIHTEADMNGKKDRPSQKFEKISGGVNPRSKAPSNSRINFRGSSGREETDSTETEGHDVSLQRNCLPRKAEDVGRKVVIGSDSDCSGRQGKSLSRQSSKADQELNLQARATRPTKGNQDRHDQLQMKANELEKLYAAHKLTSSRRGKSTDIHVDNTPMISEVKPAPVLPEKIYTKKIVKESITTNDFDSNELLKMVNNQGYNNSIPQKLGILSLQESRGKFYEQYMQKRDAKLKEDWKLQREEKEAMLKAMHENLERSKAEMLAKFARSADVPDSAYVSRCSQKIPPLQSSRKNKDQGVDSYLVEEEPNSDYLSGDGSSRSADSRKHFSNKVASTQKTSVAPVYKRSSRTVSSGYANRRNPPENPLAQSVPSFSDLRKENTRPAPGLSRATARVQQKSFARSKSIIEGSKSILKEDQSRRAQSMRKSLIPDESKDISSVNEDIYNWAPSRISKNQSEGAFGYNTRRTGPPKTFLRKGNGTRPAVGIAGFQAAMMANAFQNGDSGDFEDQQVDSPDDAKEEEEYESIEENLRESDFPVDSDSENPRMSHEFGNSDEPGSENGDVNFPSEAPTLGGTNFTSFAGNMHDSTGDLPAPWSSRLPQLFPYANDNSDGDAFADSPSGSPSPWNSHSLDEITDADVSRMRKKWGSAQMPFVGANASQQQRKDVSKGLKKLWKFGRKNRGGDGLVNDWVSASTASECDDDMEDGRDLVVGSSDDFRKSRMGYLASYDGFVEHEVFAEQEQSLRSSIPNPPANFRLREDQLTGSSLKAPRSFFSLSTFRSKGGDARLR